MAACDAGAILDSLTAEIAILDDSGCILEVNRAWREFAAANGGADDSVAEGANYLHVCEMAQGEGSEGADEFAGGIREVLAGRSNEFAREYPCHAPDRRRWYVGRVTRLSGDGPGRAVVAHADITERKRAEREIFDLNARLEDELERIQSLPRIDKAITGGLELTLTLGIVIDQVFDHFDVDVAGILLCRPEMPALGYAVRRGYRGGGGGGPSQRLDEGLAGRAVMERRTQHLDGSSTTPTSLPECYRAEGLISYWAMPLVVKGQVKGVLEAGHPSQGGLPGEYEP